MTRDGLIVFASKAILVEEDVRASLVFFCANTPLEEMARGADEFNAALVVADVTGICRQSRRKRTEPRAFPRRSLL